MRKILLLTILSYFSICLASAEDSSLKLWYDKPAATWNDALPLGNGRLGAMVFGDPVNERIQINEETIWCGGPHNNVNYQAKEALGDIRKALFENRRADALKLCNKYVSTPEPNGMPYQTAGDLLLNFKNIGDYSDYYRELDIERAVTTTTFQANGVKYTRELFVSFKYQVIAMRLSASKPSSISFNASYSMPYEKYETTLAKLDDNVAQMKVACKSDDHEGIEGKVKFLDYTLIRTDGGNINTLQNEVEVSNANSVTIYISIGTNFVNWNDVSADEVKVATTPMIQFEKKPVKWEKILAENIKEYKKQFGDISLNLGSNEQSKLPTDKRLEQFSQKFDPQFIELYFQFCRYLMISCSQPGGQPANLQGIWNGSTLPIWDSKFTTNINFEMNYWPAFQCALWKNFLPFVTFVKDCAEHGKEVASAYGCRGWTVHHNTDIWRINGVVDDAYFGMWPTGAAWLSNQLWDGYLFNMDDNYLKEIYPVMKSACEFFIDFLVEEPVSGNKYLVVAPSSSPENIPSKDPDNNNISTVFGTTMDNQMLTELFSNTIEAAEKINEKDLFVDTLKNIKSRLCPMKIGSWGQLQEWFHDWDNPKDNHRHVSHLWGLYPGHLISKDGTPDLFNAVQTSLTARGDESTGWSMGWKVCLWARLLDGNHAYRIMKFQLRPLSAKDNDHGGSYNNLFGAHPPFQIDGNFGCTAGIAEMLVQSYNGNIAILPALPDEWKDGCIKGFYARGGFLIEQLSWSNNRPVSLRIRSNAGGDVKITYAGKSVTVSTKKNKSYDIDISSFN